MLRSRPAAAAALLGLGATLVLAPSAWATPSKTISDNESLGGTLIFNELTLDAGAVLTVKAVGVAGGTGVLHIKANKITIKGTIRASDAGFAGVNKDNGAAEMGSNGGGKRSMVTGHPGGGGGYVGAGADGADLGCVALGEMLGGAAFAMPSKDLPLLGSAGGAANVNSLATAGGDGGGAVILEAAQILLDGAIEAKGQSPTPQSGVAPGGGSGGFVAIVAASLQGSGSISVAGGGGPHAPGNPGAMPPILANNGGGGSGGVILVDAKDVSPMITFITDGGATGDCMTGGGAKGTQTITSTSPCVDVDGDGFVSSFCMGGTDCDDSDATIHPMAKEGCNGVDDNCDGVADEGTDLCSSGLMCSAGKCVAIPDAGSDGGPAPDAGNPPDHVAFEGGCGIASGSDGGAFAGLGSALLGLSALAARVRRRTRRAPRSGR